MAELRCPCECNSGGFCGGCGHAGCSGGINIRTSKQDYLASRLMEPEFLKAVTDFEEQQKLAEKLVSKDPTLPYITALIVAGDQRSAERAKQLLADGKPYNEVAVWVGSYARAEFALWALENEHVEPDQFFRDWPELWRGSDPDDTDPRFLKIWLAAWRRNGGKTVYDGKQLPMRKTLDIYRGQDPLPDGGLPGIAWSLSKDVAQKFANGAALRVGNRRGVVLHARVHRKDVLAYLTERNEQEVIINPMGRLAA